MLQDLNEISDGKIYGKNDLARLACGDCEGCSACCEEMGDTIILDPLDVYHLCLGTGKTFTELLETAVELHITDGVILPHLKMQGERESCYFLNEEGRCSIHTYRPGLCRVFPLGRIYDENCIRYFLLKEGCLKGNRSKIKISKWLDISDQRQNEEYLIVWHDFRKKMEGYLANTQDENMRKTVNMFVLHHFFIQEYETERSFYEQFSERLRRAKETLPYA